MEKPNVVFRCPNNEEGKLFLALARKYLNTDSYQLRQRGRTPSLKKLKKDGYKTTRFCRQSTPLKYADNVGVYLIAKHNGSKRAVGISTIAFAEDAFQRYYKARREYEERNATAFNVHKTRLEGVVRDIEAVISMGERGV